MKLRRNGRRFDKKRPVTRTGRCFALHGALSVGRLLRERMKRRGQEVWRNYQPGHQRLGSGLGAVRPADPAGGRAERAVRRPRRRGLLGDGVVRGSDRDTEHKADRRSRSHLHEFPHDGAVLTDSLLPAHGPQPHDELDGVHHRGGVGVPERQRAHPRRVRDDPRRSRRAAAGTPTSSASGISAPRTR